MREPSHRSRCRARVARADRLQVDRLRRPRAGGVGQRRPSEPERRLDRLRASRSSAAADQRHRRQARRDRRRPGAVHRARLREHGGASSLATALKLGSQAASTALDVAADPARRSDERRRSRCCVGGGAEIIVLSRRRRPGADLPASARPPSTPRRYMQPPERADRPAETQPAQPIVASGDSVYGAFLHELPTVSVSRSASWSTVPAPRSRSAASARRGSRRRRHDDVVVWTVGRRAAGLPGQRVQRQRADRRVRGPDLAAHRLGGGRDRVPAGARLADPADRRAPRRCWSAARRSASPTASSRSTTSAAMNLTPAPEPAPIGGANTTPNLRTAAVLELPTTPVSRYVVAGYPRRSVDGVLSGKVAGLPARPHDRARRRR